MGGSVQLLSQTKNRKIEHERHVMSMMGAAGTKTSDPHLGNSLSHVQSGPRSNETPARNCAFARDQQLISDHFLYFWSGVFIPILMKFRPETVFFSALKSFCVVFNIPSGNLTQLWKITIFPG